jgi:hypothetical protein
VSVRAAFVLLVACGAASVPPASPPGTITCKLGDLGDSKLHCVATNTRKQASEVCADVFIGIVATGSIRTPHDTVCSSELEPGGGEHFAVELDVRPEACSITAGGCVVRMYPAGADLETARQVVAWARELEATATAPGRDRPTVAECGALFDKWRGDARFARAAGHLDPRDLSTLFCISLSRAELACLRAASDDAQVDACAPKPR